MTQQCDILLLSSGGQQGTRSQLAPPASLGTLDFPPGHHSPAGFQLLKNAGLNTSYGAHG